MFKGRTRCPKWLVAASVALLIAAASAACNETPAPSPAVYTPESPTATSGQPTPPSAPAPNTAEQMATYARQCGALVSAFDGMSPRALAESGEDVSWQQFAKGLESAVSAYDRLIPPPEFHAYHDAQLSYLRVYRDLARDKPGDQSAIEDYLVFVSDVFPRLLQLANDEAKTEAERKELAHEFMHGRIQNHYGPDYLAAILEQEEAEAQLSEEDRAVLDESGCSFNQLEE